MNITKKDLTKSQTELTVELAVEEFKPYLARGAERVSREVKVEGFRPGKAPYDILKNKVGEMTILEEAARLAIDKTIDKIIKENVAEQIVGQPQITITKLAPGNALEYKIILTLLPEVTPGDYKNIKVKPAKTEVTDEEINKLINELRENMVREEIAEKEAALGDKVIVDIDMFLDKIPADGGQGKDTGIIMGKNYIVPGFDKNLLGAKKNDTREFSLPYPADFHQANLAGKLVEFRVKIKEILQRILPELNQEFVKNFGLTDVAEFKSNINKSLLAEKERKETERQEMELLDKIVSQTKFGDLPELLINHEADVMMSELEYHVKSQGGKFDDYLTSLKKTKELLKLDLLPDAIKRVKTSLLIQKIASLEKIEVSQREIDQAMADLLEKYKNQTGVAEKIRSQAYRHYLENSLSGQKVIAKLREWNVEK